MVTQDAVSDSDTTVTVNLSDLTGSATAGDDYTDGSPYTVTIPAGSLSATLTVDVTTLDDNADEPTPEDFTATITNVDNDTGATIGTASATGLIIDNDATPAVGTSEASVSEEGLQGGIPDTDGSPADTTNEKIITGTIAVSDADGDSLTVTLDDPPANGDFTSGGADINWSGQGTNTLVGTAGTEPIITISVDNSGNYTVTLSGPIDHPTVDVEDISSFDVTVKAYDGAQFSTNTLNFKINIEDDSPLSLTPDTLYVEDGATTPGIAVENLNFIPGADGTDNVIFFQITEGSPALDNDLNELKFNGESLYLHYGTDGTTGEVDQTIVLATTSDIPSEGIVGFTIDLDPVAGTYEFNSNGMITNGTETNATDLTSVGGGNNSIRALFDINGTGESVIMTTATGESINTTAHTIGISGGASFSSGEAIRFDFVDNLIEETFDTDLTYDTHLNQVGFRQVIESVVGSDPVNLTVRAFLDDDNGNDFYGDDTDVAELSTNHVKVYDDTGLDVTNGGTITLTPGAVAGSITISGLQAGWTFEIDTSETEGLFFNAVQVGAADVTAKFKLGFFSYGENSFGDPINLQFDVQGIDGDGDTADGIINTTIFPNGGVVTGTDGPDDLTGGDGDDTLLGDGGVDHLDGGAGDDIVSGGVEGDTLDGGPGNDTLDGGSGGDTLDGGADDDTMIGGSGADTFRAGEGNDTIIDYDETEGDVIDISGVAGASNGNLSVSKNADGTVNLSVDGSADNTITFSDIDYVDGSSPEENLDSLLGQVEIDDGTTVV